MIINVAGVDVGFRKTGVTVFSMTRDENKLIAATTVCPDEPATSVLHRDVLSCFSMLDGVVGFLVEHNVEALFLEFPAGGSQSGRASRCMGMATGMAAAILQLVDWPKGYEIYSPSQIEVLLGIKSPPGAKKGMKKSLKSAEKKAALKEVVLEHYPDFNGWPKKVALAEDAYDSATAFLAAQRNTEEGLYHRLRRIVEGPADG